VQTPAALSTRRLILTLGLVALAAGFGQFGATSALGQVAKAFGTVTDQQTFTAQAGLSGGTIAIGLGVLRAASLLALPLSALADRVGRHRMLFVCGVSGLLVTASWRSSRWRDRP
jgi:MFS family permease